MEGKPFAERKALLNLAQMAQTEAVLDEDTFQNLIATLIVCLRDTSTNRLLADH